MGHASRADRTGWRSWSIVMVMVMTKKAGKHRRPEAGPETRGWACAEPGTRAFHHFRGRIVGGRALGLEVGGVGDDTYLGDGGTVVSSSGVVVV